MSFSTVLKIDYQYYFWLLPVTSLVLRGSTVNINLLEQHLPTSLSLNQLSEYLKTFSAKLSLILSQVTDDGDYGNKSDFSLLQGRDHDANVANLLSIMSHAKHRRSHIEKKTSLIDQTDSITGYESDDEDPPPQNDESILGVTPCLLSEISVHEHGVILSLTLDIEEKHNTGSLKKFL